MISVPVGAHLVVLIPPAAPAGTEEDTDVTIADELIVNEQCSVSLPNHTRRTILTAVHPGTTALSATIAPPTETLMPAWSGTVIVTDQP
jgi:hypothetical protein